MDKEMTFTLTVRYPTGGGQRDTYDLEGLRAELKQLAMVLDALVPGETVEIKRIA